MFNELPGRAKDALHASIRAVEGIAPLKTRSWDFPVSELPDAKAGATILEEAKVWLKGDPNCLYLFECTNPPVDFTQITRAFADYKAREANGRACPRLNDSSACFYVGSSQQMTKRLAEHLGYGAAKTYALQLRHWARPLNISMRFSCASYSDDIPYSTVQLLEDSLWNWKLPMFGRLGRK